MISSFCACRLGGDSRERFFGNETDRKINPAQPHSSVNQFRDMSEIGDDFRTFSVTAHRGLQRQGHVLLDHVTLLPQSRDRTLLGCSPYSQRVLGSDPRIDYFFSPRRVINASGLFGSTSSLGFPLEDRGQFNTRKQALSRNSCGHQSATGRFESVNRWSQVH